MSEYLDNEFPWNFYFNGIALREKQKTTKEIT